MLFLFIGDETVFLLMFQTLLEIYKLHLFNAKANASLTLCYHPLKKGFSQLKVCYSSTSAPNVTPAIVSHV